jgi:AcrR family transcriptional regulator
MPRATDAKPTRVRILDAAEQVFAERGYDAASLGDVADRVGIRPQAIYNHYKGKWELWVAVLERLLDPLFETLDAALEGPPTPERGKRGLAAEIALHARNPNLARVVQYPRCPSPRSAPPTRARHPACRCCSKHSAAAPLRPAPPRRDNRARADAR